MTENSLTPNKENHIRNMTQEKILNRYLLSIDSSYDHVEFKAKNAHIYRFEEEWAEMEIEGSLYIYSRTAERGYILIVFNRKGLNDFKLNIPKDFYLELDNQFVIFSHSDKKNIFGFWFEQIQEAKDFHQILEIYKNL
jgi:hypothetical protein